LPLKEFHTHVWKSNVPPVAQSSAAKQNTANRQKSHLIKCMIMRYVPVAASTRYRATVAIRATEITKQIGTTITTSIQVTDT